MPTAAVVCRPQVCSADRELDTPALHVFLCTSIRASLGVGGLGHCNIVLNRFGIIMVALWNRADHYVFMLLFVLSSFFPRLILTEPPQIGCLPYFHTWRGLSANLRCRSQTCCTRLAENTGRKKVAKNHHLGTIAQLCQASAAMSPPHVLTIW